jgi:hypothetical protein
MSLQLHWPTKDGVLTQGFGERPEYYSRFGLPGHDGVDFHAPEGTKVYACADGLIVDSMSEEQAEPVNKPYGNYVRIDHGDGYFTIYAHLSRLVAVKGQNIRAGELIGLSGNTGNSQGAHLHLALKKRGASSRGETRFPYDFIDPTPFLVPYRAPGGQVDESPAPTRPAIQVQVNSPEVGYLNIRSAASPSASLIVQAKDKSLLDALDAADVVRARVGQQNQWLRVRTSDGKEGYAAAWYLEFPAAPAPAPVSAPTPTQPQTISVVVNSPMIPLKVRRGPGIQFDILAQAPHGTQLASLESPDATRAKVGQLGQWLQVQTPEGVTGYCAAWYLKL